MMAKQGFIRPLPQALVLLQYLLAAGVVCMIGVRKGVGALTLTRGGPATPDEFYNVFMGGTLNLTCYVSNHLWEPVRWAKCHNSELSWLTANSTVLQDYARLSISVFRYNNSYRAYSIQIMNITRFDLGFYKCCAWWWRIWWYDVCGYAHVHVDEQTESFPRENPTCSKTLESPTNITVWCETVQDVPGVNISWTIKETGEKITARGYHSRTEQQQRVGASFHLEQRLWNQVLVCTVTSSAFPGLNRKCSIGPFDRPTSTAETQNSYGPITLHGHKDRPTTLPRSLQTAVFMNNSVDSQLQTVPTPPDPTKGYNNSGAIAAGVIIPALFGLSFLILIIRHKWPRKNWVPNDGASGRTATNAGSNDLELHDVVVIPYAVTTLPTPDSETTKRYYRSAHEAASTSDAKTLASPYERNKDTLCMTEVQEQDGEQG
ncbi:uncharacterized protein LOC110990001 [Acanthaster planci]|uniref:Uncharacterized protein LOC110990001 n=1 Tax=Acanthaster planci TaxID=133434 RepID=A0A8B7ZY24_ACAPL|nr:uncharacterized protein LOC110990001 [Acanthaster planci]